MTRLTAILICVCVAAPACASGGATGLGDAHNLIGHAPDGSLRRLRHGDELVLLAQSLTPVHPALSLVGYNPASHVTRVLTPCVSHCTAGGWSPDGRWLAYTSECDPRQTPPCDPKGGLWVERAGAPPRRLIPHPTLTWSWAPHGSMLADMFKPYDRPTTLTVVDPATGRTRVLTRIHGWVRSQVAWSPDGSKIAFALGKAIEIVPVHDGAPVIVPLAGWPEWPYGQNLTWSPDSRRIAVGMDLHLQGGHTRIDVVPASGSRGPRPLVVGGFFPTWSPDGRWIAYLASPTGGRVIGLGGLWTVRPDGSHRVFLGRTSFCSQAVWSPNGRRLAWIVDGCQRYVESPAGHPDVRPFRRVRMAEWLEAPSRVYLNQRPPGL